MSQSGVSRTFLCTLFPTDAELADVDGWVDSVKAVVSRLIDRGDLANCAFQLERCSGKHVRNDERHAESLLARGLAHGRDVPAAPVASVSSDSDLDDGDDLSDSDGDSSSQSADDGDEFPSSSAAPVSPAPSAGAGRLHLQFCCIS